MPPPRVVFRPSFIVAAPRGSPHGRGERTNARLRTGQYQTNTHRLYSSGTVFVLPLVWVLSMWFVSTGQGDTAGDHNSCGPAPLCVILDTVVEATMATDVVNSDARLMLLFA